MDTEEKREVLIQAVGDSWDDIHKVIHHLVSKKTIEYKNKQKMLDCVVDTFLYGKDKQINTAFDILNRDKFPQYIRGLIFSLALKPRSSFNYISKMDFNTESLDDENARNIVQ